jgi:hypothetical protein
MRVLICGDRNWRNFHLIAFTLSGVCKAHNVECVIDGAARGADTMGFHAATLMKLPTLRFPADWKKHGKAAGPIRNRQMLTEGKPDLVLAFHNSIESSKGTADMVRIARKADIETRVVTESNGYS